MPRRIAVWLSVSPEKEEEFNSWYEQTYIPRFVTQVPGIEQVTRWKVDEAQTYMTLYDIADGVAFDEVSEALRSPSRDVDRKEWKRWEEEHLVDFRDGFFSQVFAYRPELAASE